MGPGAVRLCYTLIYQTEYGTDSFSERPFESSFIK